jgi:hypothetical protein
MSKLEAAAENCVTLDPRDVLRGAAAPFPSGSRA